MDLPEQTSEVDMSTFIDVLNQEDDARFENMFMAQDDDLPLQQIFPGIDTQDSEQVYELVTSMIPELSAKQFHMLQRIFAGTQFKKKHGDHESQFRQKYNTQNPPFNKFYGPAKLEGYNKEYQATFDRINRGEEEYKPPDQQSGAYKLSLIHI